MQVVRYQMEGKQPAAKSTDDFGLMQFLVFNKYSMNCSVEEVIQEM